MGQTSLHSSINELHCWLAGRILLYYECWVSSNCWQLYKAYHLVILLGGESEPISLEGALPFCCEGWSSQMESGEKWELLDMRDLKGEWLLSPS